MTFKVMDSTLFVNDQFGLTEWTKFSLIIILLVGIIASQYKSKKESK